MISTKAKLKLSSTKHTTSLTHYDAVPFKTKTQSNPQLVINIYTVLYRTHALYYIIPNEHYCVDDFVNDHNVKYIHIIYNYCNENTNV